MRYAALLCLLAALAATGCVVTTFESPSEPPRGAVEPIWPPLGQPPAASTGAGEPGVTPTAARPDVITARHILIMHRGSMRAPETITRSKEEAKKRAEEALKRAKAGEDFVKLVKEYSDEPGAATRGGNLGQFGHGMMVKEFEDAAFGLEPGQISDVIETPFGFHIIQRTE
jgi:peptidyl-prolyl cis-trans isomerase NIMA-interacting 1